MAEKQFTISKHARRRIAQRGISISQLQRTLDYPDRQQIDPEDPELRHAVKTFHHPGGSRTLRVVYNETVVPWRIVTAFFEHYGKKKL